MNELQLNVELMERRMMMAGDVSARITSGGDLVITGDNADNAVSVYRTAIPDLGLGVRIDGHDGTKVNGEDSFLFLYADAVTDDIRINLRGGDNRIALLSEDAPAGDFGWEIVDDLVISSGSGNDVIILQMTSVDDITIRSGAGEDAIAYEIDAYADRVRVNSGRGNDLVSAFDGAARTDITTGSGDDVFIAAGVQGAGEFGVSLGSGDDAMLVINGNFPRGVRVNGGSGIDRITDTTATAPLDYGSGLVTRRVEAHAEVSGSEWLQARFDAMLGTRADDAQLDFMFEIGMI